MKPAKIATPPTTPPAITPGETDGELWGGLAVVGSGVSVSVKPDGVVELELLAVRIKLGGAVELEL